MDNFNLYNNNNNYKYDFKNFLNKYKITSNNKNIENLDLSYKSINSLPKLFG